MPKPLTPCEQRGYKVGDRFRNSSAWFGGRPCNLTLEVDDGTYMPPFCEEKDSSRSLFVEIRQVKPIIRVRAGEPFAHLLPKAVQVCVHGYPSPAHCPNHA